MASINEILEGALEAQIARLYTSLFEAVVAADGDEDALAAAQARFKSGLELAMDALDLAREAANS